MIDDVKTWFKVEVRQEDIGGNVFRNIEKIVLARAISRALSKGDAEFIPEADCRVACYRIAEEWGFLCPHFHDEKAFLAYLVQFNTTGKVDPTTFIVYGYELPERVVEILRDKGLLLDGEPK